MRGRATSQVKQDVSWSPVTVADLHLRLLDDPIVTPVHTSFGAMHSRPGLLLRLTGADGLQGFGEVWCNFPEGGARYKAMLLASYVRPVVLGQRFDQPEQVLRRLCSLFAVLRLQCADHGAIAQLIAGMDLAVWDLFCKRRGPSACAGSRRIMSG